MLFLNVSAYVKTAVLVKFLLLYLKEKSFDSKSVLISFVEEKLWPIYQTGSNVSNTRGGRKTKRSVKKIMYDFLTFLQKNTNKP